MKNTERKHGAIYNNIAVHGLEINNLQIKIVAIEKYFPICMRRDKRNVSLTDHMYHIFPILLGKRNYMISLF